MRAFCRLGLNMRSSDIEGSSVLSCWEGVEVMAGCGSIAVSIGTPLSSFS